MVEILKWVSLGTFVVAIIWQQFTLAKLRPKENSKKRPHA